MKKIRWIAGIIASVLLCDFACIALFERPLLAIKDDSDSVEVRYMGIFYDVVDCLESETVIVSKFSKYACPVSEITQTAPMVQINDTLYIQTGRIQKMAKCGVMDGEITSSLSENEIPSQDNQSNFGTGYGYQYGTDGIIEVLLDGQWHLFASEEVFDKFVLNLSEYRKVTELAPHQEVDVNVLLVFEERLYAKSNLMIDVNIPDEEPAGMIMYIVDEQYIPKLDKETNSEEYLGALVYPQADGKSLLVNANGVYCLFELLEQNK